jgi:hypothetical protein
MIEALGVPHTEVDIILVNLVNDGPSISVIWCRTATASAFTPFEHGKFGPKGDFANDGADARLH